MKTRILLATLALSVSALGQSTPPPPTITLEVPVEAAGHSFQLWENYYNPAMVFSGQPVYDALTGKFLVTGDPPYGWTYWTAPLLINDTLGTQWNWSSYISEPTTLSVTMFDPGTIGYAVDAARSSHVLGLVVPGYNWSFPVSSTGVLGSTVVDSDGNSQFASLGFFNAFAQTYDPSLSASNTALVDLTASQQSPLGVTDLRGLAWGSRTVFPTRVATFSLGTVDWQYSAPQGVSYTLHTASSTPGSLQNLVPQLASIYDPVTSSYTYELRVSGQVGVGENYWLTNQNGTQSTAQFFMGAANSEVVQSGAPFSVPYSDFQTLTFSIGENHFNEWLAVSQNGSLIPVTPYTSGGTLTTWDQTGTAISYSYGTYTSQSQVDLNQPWTLVSIDYWSSSVIQDFGQITQLFDGFTPWNPVSPAGAVSFAVAAGRAGSLDGGQLRLQNTDGTQWLVSPASDTDLYNFSVTIGDVTYPVQYRLVTAPSTALQGWAGDTATIVDLANGDTGIIHPSTTSSYELATWAPLTTINLWLPAQRWAHDVRVRTALGDDVRVSAGALQGVWSGGSFTTYGFYNATASIHAGVDWWIHDVSTGETASGVNIPDRKNWTGSSDLQDDDSDGLPAWYEYILGTSDDVTTGWDTDGDGIGDYQEMAAGSDPRSAKPVLTIVLPITAAWIN